MMMICLLSVVSLAQAVGLYLCTDHTVLKIFGVEDPAELPDVSAANYMLMARSGLCSLAMFTPGQKEGEAGSWRQAHSR